MASSSKVCNGFDVAAATTIGNAWPNDLLISRCDRKSIELAFIISQRMIAKLACTSAKHKSNAILRDFLAVESSAIATRFS